VASKSTRASDAPAKGDNGQLPTSERLMTTAADHFSRKGYAQTTTRELADALGIRKASLYHHISNKEDLLYEISMHSLGHIIDEVATATADVPEEERLRAMIEAHVVSALRDRDMHIVMLTEMRALNPEHHDEVVAKRDEYEAMIRAVIVVDQKAGRLRTDLKPKLLTLSLLNVLNWTIFWFDPEADLTPEDMGRVLATVFIEGAIGR
jgi:TetR/AcrR family transcriptional regulator, cholesterol catabolism regulator